MNMDDLFERRDEVLSEASIYSLVAGLIVITSEWTLEDMTPQARMVNAWLCDEIEARYPDITSHLDRYAANPDERSYTAVILEALKDIGALDDDD